MGEGGGEIQTDRQRQRETDMQTDKDTERERPFSERQKGSDFYA